ncbi:hypothetical protein ACHAXS_012513 [Conticribra weissflogii]
MVFEFNNITLTMVVMQIILHQSLKRQLTSTHFLWIQAHFQNGIAKGTIRDVQEQTRSSLLYAINCWPKVMDFSLWPYAACYAVFLHNVLPSQDDGTSRLEVFVNSSLGHRLTDCHTFGCCVYALQNTLQNGSTIPKWRPHARFRINSSPSQFHDYNVYLVFNPTTGLVSP